MITSVTKIINLVGMNIHFFNALLVVGNSSCSIYRVNCTELFEVDSLLQTVVGFPIENVHTYSEFVVSKLELCLVVPIYYKTDMNKAFIIFFVCYGCTWLQWINTQCNSC